MGELIFELSKLPILRCVDVLSVEGIKDKRARVWGENGELLPKTLSTREIKLPRVVIEWREILGARVLKLGVQKRGGERVGIMRV